MPAVIRKSRRQARRVLIFDATEMLASATLSGTTACAITATVSASASATLAATTTTSLDASTNTNYATATFTATTTSAVSATVSVPASATLSVTTIATIVTGAEVPATATLSSTTTCAASATVTSLASATLAGTTTCAAEASVTTTVNEGFRIYRMDTGALIATATSPFSWTITGLPDGEHVLGVQRVDQYLNRSTITTITVRIVGGVPYVAMVDPSNVQTRPVAGGNIRLTWLSINDGQQVNPVEFEVAHQSSPGTILQTVAFAGPSYTRDLGPYTNAETVRLIVRSSNGAGRVGRWVDAPPVVADSAPPPVPVLVG